MRGDDIRVQVHGEWNGWEHGEVLARNIEDLHWTQPPGAPHELLHGFISCGDILAGRVPHDCPAGCGTHRLLVCILKRHALASTYTALAESADPRPRQHPYTLRAAKGPSASRRLRIRVGFQQMLQRLR